MTVNIATIGETFANDVKAFRSAAVTADNKATPFARSALASLVAGTRTVTQMETAIIHAFGNPKSPKSGKPIAKLNSGGDHLPGWGAVRKTFATIAAIFADIDADKAREVEDAKGETVTIGTGAIRNTIVAFILAQDDAPKSLKALSDAVKSHLRDFVKVEAETAGADNSEAVADNEAAEAETAPVAAAPVAATLADMMNVLTVRLSTATDDELNDAYAAMEALVAAYDARINAATAAPEAMAA